MILGKYQRDYSYKDLEKMGCGKSIILMMVLKKVLQLELKENNRCCQKSSHSREWQNKIVIARREFHSVYANAIKENKSKTKKSNPIGVAFLFYNVKIYLLGFIKSTFLYLSLIFAKVLSASIRVLKLPTHTL